MALNLGISQGAKTRFEPNFKKSHTLSLPVHLEKTLSDLEKMGENLETPSENKRFPTLRQKYKSLVNSERP